MVAAIGCLQHQPFLRKIVGPPARPCPLSSCCFKPASKALKPAVWSLTPLRCLSLGIQGQNRPQVCAGAAASAAPTMAVGVSQRMKELRDQGRVAFIPFLVAGDPDLETTEEALKRLDAAGADVIELGIPYSDPLADGPTIQSASTRSLAKGTTVDKVLNIVKRVSPQIRAPIVIFLYFNPILYRTIDKMCQQLADSGAKGLLVPDIALEETGQVRDVANKYGLELVLLSTPTTRPERAEAIAKVTQGFLYLVSVAGVTGQRTSMESRLEGLLSQLHSVTDKSIAVGFGVSGPSQVKQLVEWGAEGVIVGSALVKALASGDSPAEGLQAMEKLAKELRGAMP